MIPGEFTGFEIERLYAYKQLIGNSLVLNPEIDGIKRQEIMKIIDRAFQAEIEYIEGEPKEYKNLYYR